jgi:hypothetical protein
MRMTREEFVQQELEKCRRKSAFPTRGKAANALSKVRSKGAAVTHVYKCPYCRQFHLTSKKVKGYDDKARGCSQELRTHS